MRISNIKVIEDDIDQVSCSGDQQSGMHPQIFLKVSDEDGSVECYYCGKVFIRKSKFNNK